MSRGLLERRRGALPPILVVLITIAAIVSATLVAWFMITTTSSAVKQPVLQVTEAYVTGTTTITLTARNIGVVDLVSPTFPGNPPGTCSPSGVQLTSCSVVAGNLDRGGSMVMRCTTSATPRDGDMCTLTLQATNQQTGQIAVLTLNFRVVRP
jgi:hypothetical protein